MICRIEKGDALRGYWAPLREEIFVREQGFQEEFDEIDRTAWHLVLLDGEEAVATGRLFPQEESGDCYVLGRIAVSRSRRGQNLGARVVSELCEKARSLGARRCALSAQTRARGFYEKLGFAAFGEEYLDEYCPHIRMEREL